jgi:hypothetical protein
MLCVTYIVHLTSCSCHPKQEIKGPFQVPQAPFWRFWTKNSPFWASLQVTFTTIVQFMTDRYPLHEQSVRIVQYISFLFEQHYTSVSVVGCSITSVISVEYSIGLCVVII